jgi:hypothetical protein
MTKDSLLADLKERVRLLEQALADPTDTRPLPFALLRAQDVETTGRFMIKLIEQSETETPGINCSCGAQRNSLAGACLC